MLYVIEYAQEKRSSLKVKHILCDFEASLHKAILSRLDVVIICCFFHFVKSLWKKCAKLGLKTQENLTNTKQAIDHIKILVHLPVQLRQDYFKKIESEKLFSGEKFKLFFNYLKKNYIGEKAKFASFLNYNLDGFDLENDLYIRSNNVIEGYHNRFFDFKN